MICLHNKSSKNPDILKKIKPPQVSVAKKKEKVGYKALCLSPYWTLLEICSTIYDIWGLLSHTLTPSTSFRLQV